MMKKLKHILPLIILIPFLARCSGNSKIAPTEIPEKESTPSVEEADNTSPDNDAADWILYKNDELGFQLKYPDEWVSPAILIPHQNDFLFSAGDGNFPESVGGKTGLRFMIKVVPENEYKKEEIVDYISTEDILEPIQTETIEVGNKEAVKEKYMNSAPEMAKEIIYSVEMKKNGQVYHLKFQYTIAGCEAMPEDSRKSCSDEMESFEKKNVELMRNILSFFQFTENDNEFEKTDIVTIFLVDLYAPDKKFTKKWLKETGCGDHLVPVERKIKPTKAKLKASLNELFLIKDNVPEDLYNALQSSDFQIDSLKIVGDKAIVYLSGPYTMGGSCDTPRFNDQIEETVLQFNNIKEAEIYINGKLLKSFISAD